MRTRTGLIAVMVALFLGLIRVVQDSARPRTVRLAALDVLVSYYEVGGTLPSAAADTGIDVKWCVVGGQVDYHVRDGAVPITAADRPSIMQAVETVAATESDPVVRHAAACAAAGMHVL